MMIPSAMPTVVVSISAEPLGVFAQNCADDTTDDGAYRPANGRTESRAANKPDSLRIVASCLRNPANDDGRRGNDSGSVNCADCAIYGSMYFKRSAFIYGVAIYHSVKSRSAARANNYALDAHAMEIKNSARAHYDISRDHSMKDKDILHFEIAFNLSAFSSHRCPLISSFSVRIQLATERVVRSNEMARIPRPPRTCRSERDARSGRGIRSVELNRRIQAVTPWRLNRSEALAKSAVVAWRRSLPSFAGACR